MKLEGRAAQFALQVFQEAVSYYGTAKGPVGRLALLEALLLGVGARADAHGVSERPEHLLDVMI